MSEPDASTSSAPSGFTRVKRLPERGHYDRETIDPILDAGFVCHLGHVVEGQPVVTPTMYWRHGDQVYFHGSAASRMLKTLGSAAIRCCLTVTHADGLVLARSGFHHSMNYRSVMLFGSATMVEDPEEKRAALEAFVERLFPGRWPGLRPVTAQELKATTVMRLAIDEASAKVRTGPPKDDEEDYGLPIWAGVIPLTVTAGAPEPDPRLHDPSLSPPALRLDPS